MNLIELTCQSKYVSWHASKIKYKITSSNTFQEESSLLLFSCFSLSCLIIFVPFLKNSYVIDHENLPKMKLKYSLVLFRLHNPKIFRQIRIL